MFAVTYKKIWLIITAVLFLGSLALVLAFGLKPGIDFAGGSLTEVAYGTNSEDSSEKRESPAKEEVEAAVATLGLGNFSVRESNDETGRSGYLVRTRALTEEERIALAAAVTTVEPGGEVTRFTSIGPIIGQELRDKAVWAIGAVALIIVLYVAFAFAGIGTPVSSWVYGGITIFVLIHDVLIPTAVVSVLGYLVGMEVDVLFVMAILAVLGYSVNDTIVVFDRVRENLKQFRTERKVKRNEAGIVKEDIVYTLTKPFSEIVGLSVSQTLARSINTSFTTLLTLIALYFIGGSVTQTFVLVLMVGVIAGTYSSICIASPILVAYEEWQAKKASATNNS